MTPVIEILGWNQDATPRLRINTKLHNLPAGTKLYHVPPDVVELVEAAKEAADRLERLIEHSEDLVAHMRLVKAIEPFLGEDDDTH